MLTISRIIKLIFLNLITSLVIIACSSSDTTVQQTPNTNQSNNDCRTIEHALDTTKICGQPEKIVVLSPHHLDLLLSLGYQPTAYGFSYAMPGTPQPENKFDNPSQQIPYLGEQVTTQPINLGLGSEPSLEKLAALKPDVIFGEIRNKGSYDLLKQIAPTFIWDVRTMGGQWQETIKDMAKILGEEEKAEQAIATHQKAIDNARKDLASVVEKHPNLLLLGMSNLQNQVAVIQPNTYLGEVIQGVGFEMVSLPSVEGKGPSVPISIEALPQLNEADIIIVLGYSADIEETLETSSEKSLNSFVQISQSKPAQQAWQSNKIANSLKASQNDRVYFTTYYLWNGLNGPNGTQLILEQLRDFLL
ncbi:ABC transporter substrate-binding protein [Crocosphaera chwakensis]|uniref:Iron(III) dicitrate-binding protein of ABC transporter n=1 Tax=Crocosphaera chwakensis CCY0110 TaxID=391612 RepID=A3ISC0_9CHRO|nr:iron-siderophore ABC transporter substrate-binding protein [Crocosphaera chwakensis]EAZ90636.1 iron(III) dicitrate-binding protein of ABC transporter [Crocosphaera chwakensis CCY0110]